MSGVSTDHSGSPRTRRRLRLRATAVIGLTVLAIMFAGMLLAPVIAPFDPNAQDVSRRLIGPFRPGSPYLLGTDHVGRDVLSRMIYGARVAWMIGAIAVLLSGIVGVFLGLLAGFYGGVVDDAITWLANVELAFPFILLAIVVAASLGAGWESHRGPYHRELGNLRAGGPGRNPGATRAGVRRGCAGARRKQLENHPDAPSPQRAHARDRHCNLRVLADDHLGGCPVFPWPRGPAVGAIVGVHACRRSSISGDGVVGGHVPRTWHHRDRAGHQPGG